MGTPEFAVPILKKIYDSEHTIKEVYTKEPKKKNRGQKLEISPINKFCEDKKIKVRLPTSINELECDHIKKINPDVVVVVAYGLILPKELLNTTNIRFINIHASLLPKWRGAAPIQRAIMNLDQETGISIMKIVPKLDAGPVMMKSKIKIFKDTNYTELSKQMSALASKMIVETLTILENNEEEFINQNETEATYAEKISKEESKIKWNEDAKKIIARINALKPNPGSWFELNNLRIKVLKAVEVNSKGKPGEVIDNNFTIACSNNAIRVIELKKEGKTKMSANEFLRGNPLNKGTVIE